MTPRERLEAMRHAPEAPPQPHEYAIGESGHTLKGVSILTDAGGKERERWTKTSRAGRDDSAVAHIPDPKLITKVSTLYDQDGQVTQQWIAEKPADADKEALWQAIADRLVEGLPARPPLAPSQGRLAADFMACIPVGDHHNGLLSWSKETGASYDLDIAAQLLAQGADDLLARMPQCEQALIAILGDWLHYDSFEPVTPTSRNMLDSDGRYPKMIDVGLDSAMYLIERACERHGKVHVIVEIGNHDLSTSVFLARALARIYRDWPQVTIDTSPMHFHYFEFGKVLIGTHHGHGVKMQDLPLIMATDRPEAWGRTRHRYVWTGHVHHARTVFTPAHDHTGVSVESFRVLAPVDAWAHQRGYRSLRDMKGIVMHREFGEVDRLTVNPYMLLPQNSPERMAA